MSWAGNNASRRVDAREAHRRGDLTDKQLEKQLGELDKEAEEHNRELNRARAQREAERRALMNRSDD